MSNNPQELTFSFEGRTIRARRGQTIAGALHQTGVRTLSRSVKYHVPRGYTCGFGACGGCPLNINGLPNTVSCTTPVQGGEVVKREGGLPSARFDLLRTADGMRRWLGAGFQFKLFAKQPRLSKLAGTALAHLAGGGRFPTRAAVAASRVTRVDNLRVDVLVLGGGLSGLTAALEAANAGRTVAVVDRDFRGGRSAVRTEPVTDGGTPVDASNAFRRAYDSAVSHRSITLVEGVAAGFIDGFVPVISGTVRVELSAPAVILAAGSYEVPVLLKNHDRPGVMFADAALKLARIEGVRPGQRAVVVRAADRAEDVATALRAENVEVVDTVDAEDVERVIGFGRAKGVRVRGSDGKRRTVPADLVCIAGQRRPADELVLHAEYDAAGSHEKVTRDGFEPTRGTARVGSMTGTTAYDLADVRDTTRALLDDTLPVTNPSEIDQ